MNPSRLFIQRPVATSLLMLAILLGGLIAYRVLPLSALPQVDYPTIQVVTLYPGASPQVAASSITAPLERQFGQMPGLRQMSSSSSGGASVITLQFNLELALDVAEQEVQAAINAAANLLPADLPAPPIYSKVNPADAPVLTLAVTSATMPLARLHSLVDTRIARRIAQQAGVGMVTLAGGQRPAVRIRANPGALAAYGLSLEDVRAAVANGNVNQPKGLLDGPARSTTIDANGQLKSAEEYADLIIAYRNGRPLRMREVAEAIDATENSRLAAWANRSAAILVNIQRQPGANVIEVADRVKALLPELQASLPGGLEVVLLSDRTVTIRASVKDVQFELMLAVALVVMVIFLFLRNLAATAVPSVAVPLSLVGTFAAMYLAGFSINNLTLMALTIAAGFVVDDAIVMIENIARYVEAGDTPLAAALKGSRQIAFTIISLTFSLVAVLIPLLFMEDVVGRLFREFAITLAVAILISAVVSLTLTPMMCARLLRRIPEAEQGAFYRAGGRFFERLTAAYGAMLRWVLDREAAALLVSVALVALTVWLYIAIPKGFFPVQDTGAIQGITQAPQSVSFAAMAERQQALARVLLADPAVESVSSFIGVDGVNATLNSGRMLISLKPLERRGIDAAEVIRRLKPGLEQVRGIALYLQPLQDLTLEDRVSRTQYQFTVEGAHADEVSTWGRRLADRLSGLPQLADVASDAQEQGLQAYVEINRDAASRLGVSVSAIGNALYSAFGQRLISTIFTETNQQRVVLELQPRFRQGLDALDELHVPAANGGQVRLGMVARVVERPTPLVINHVGQFPAATISFNLAPGVALGEAVEAIRAAERDIGMPGSVQTRFQGAALAFEASAYGTLLLIVAALVTMYIVLGVLYESYVHPITILSTLPSAAVGALLALMAARTELNLIAVIGLVLLIGIVKKNAIMMIDFALDAQRREGRSAREAIYQACLLRLRPILMTTLCALLGALPLMLGSGVGSELRQPLGITMVGGLLLSQALTLFTTPVIYLAFERLAAGRGTAHEAAAGAADMAAS